jgi:hypothetical protein
VSLVDVGVLGLSLGSMVSDSISWIIGKMADGVSQPGRQP